MRRWLFALSLVVATPACAAVSGFDDLEPSDCTGSACDDASGGDGSSDAISDARTDAVADATDGEAFADTFDGGDAVATDAPTDTSGGDTSPTDTSPGDALDTSVADTLVDSGPADSGPADSGPADSGPADSGPVDSGPVDSSPPDTGPSDTGSTSDGGGCGGTAGPTMINVGSFCIDSTEVTKSQYKAFADAKGSDTSGQPAYCSWNTSYTPPLTGGWGWPYAAGEENLPMAAMDWCDAYAYCKWAGKRLCGKIGGGASPYASFATTTANQWYYACTGNGATLYPYGNTYQPTYCQGGDIKPNKLINVGSKTTCGGGFPGIYDMSGNAWELEDSCDATAGAADNCRIRGGSDLDSAANLTCAVDWYQKRNAIYINVGFRCCSP